MKATEGVVPTLGERGPEKYGAARKNNCGGPFGQNSEAQKETEEEQSHPRSSRKNRRVFVANQSDNNGGTDHGDGQHPCKRHVCCGGMRKADNADGGGERQEKPARGFCPIPTPG